MNTRLCLQLVV